MIFKNRGALSNPEGRFEINRHQFFDDGWENNETEEITSNLETILYPEQSKSIITHNDSPDISFDQSINPYRGCEHGCIYCYARPAHAYVNLSPGLDFETKIFYKVEAASLLEKELKKSTYRCRPIIIGSNTDPYQPTEAKLKITRSLLEVLKKFHHPVVIITKGSLIKRDLDILSEMANDHLVKVAISITTLSISLKQILEPRTSDPQSRLRIIQQLSQANIPVRVMAAPMIPFINDCELENILKRAKQAGANHASYTLIRLPHEVKDLFKEWLRIHFPQRATHVMSIIRQMRKGKEYDSTFGKRMQGEGKFAELLAKRFQLACNKFKLNESPTTPLNIHLFKPTKNSSQLEMLFD